MSTFRAVQSTVTLIAFCLLIIALGCSDGPPTAADPHAPGSPSHPFPADRADDQPLTVTLRWSCADPDGDSLIYSLYVGTEIPLPLVDSMITDTTYTISPLSFGRVYYWYVMARDPDGRQTGSRVWSFFTRAGFFYPLTIGNRWEYAGEMYFINFRPDSLKRYIGADTIPETSVVEITGLETLLDTIVTHVFHETLTLRDDTFHTDTYFGETEEGLYYYAYSSPPYTKVTPLKIKPNGYFYFKGRRFNTVQEIFSLIKEGVEAFAKRSNGIIYENPPLKSLQYPLEVGSQWTYREPGNPLHMDKRISVRQNISVPAGDFDCFEIQWLYDIDEDGQWDDDIELFDYMSTTGLIKRSITIRDLIYIDYEVGGMVDWSEEFVLTGYQVE